MILQEMHAISLKKSNLVEKPYPLGEKVSLLTLTQLNS